MYKLLAIFAVISAISAQVPAGRHYVSILRQRQEIDPIGSYNWQFETENGISAKEEGRLRPVPGARGSDEALRAEGEYKYKGADGAEVYVNYVADELGFQPQSDVIPTPPPVPEYIIRSLEWQRAHPQQPSKRF